jgi:hypothetical protein
MADLLSNRNKSARSNTTRCATAERAARDGKKAGENPQGEATTGRRIPRCGSNASTMAPTRCPVCLATSTSRSGDAASRGIGASGMNLLSRGAIVVCRVRASMCFAHGRSGLRRLAASVAPKWSQYPRAHQHFARVRQHAVDCGGTERKVWATAIEYRAAAIRCGPFC